MPIFCFEFDNGDGAHRDDPGLDFTTLDEAYLEVCKAIPGMAKEILTRREDPLAVSCKIVDASGRTLITVPFTDVLSPAEWRLAKARRRPHGGPRSTRARDRMALTSFRQMFSSVNAGCVLLTPEMRIVEMNAFGARHSHVDAEAVRGLPIYDIFDGLRGKPKEDFTQFMSLAQAGAASEVIDLPYLMLDPSGQTTNGWWNARTWPIFDDDDHVLGFVEWAEPHPEPTRAGRTEVKLMTTP